MAGDSPQTTENPADDPFGHWLDAARQGSDSALAQGLEQFRGYLVNCATAALTADLRVKVSPSDLVQESMIDAHHGFARFGGNTRAELLRWLRKIVAHNAADVARKYRDTSKRAIAREVSFADDDEEERSRTFVAAGRSPSSLVGQLEEEETVVQAMARLPGDYRRAIELRNLHGLTYQEVGQQMGRSPEAVRKLWTRAFERLSQELIARHGTRQDESSG